MPLISLRMPVPHLTSLSLWRLFQVKPSPKRERLGTAEAGLFTDWMPYLLHNQRCHNLYL